MNLEFQDYQDRSNPLNGCKLGSEASRAVALNSLRSRQPFVAVLTGEHGYSLLIGLSKHWCSVQHSKTNGEVPYLMAFGPNTATDDMEFLCGDTPTPIPARFLVEFDTMLAIVNHFSQTGEPAPFVEWEEV